MNTDPVPHRNRNHLNSTDSLEGSFSNISNSSKLSRAFSLEPFFKNQFDSLDSDFDNLLDIEEVALFIQYNYDCDTQQALQEARKIFSTIFPDSVNTQSEKLNFQSFLFAFTHRNNFINNDDTEQNISVIIKDPTGNSNSGLNSTGNTTNSVVNSPSKSINDPLSTPYSFNHRINNISNINPLKLDNDFNQDPETPTQFTSTISDEQYRQLQEQLYIWKNRAEWISDKYQRLTSTMSEEQEKQDIKKFDYEDIQSLQKLKKEKYDLLEQISSLKQIDANREEENRKMQMEYEAKLHKLNDDVKSKNNAINQMHLDISEVSSLKNELKNIQKAFSDNEKILIERDKSLEIAHSQLDKEKEKNINTSDKYSHTEQSIQLKNNEIDKLKLLLKQSEETNTFNSSKLSELDSQYKAAVLMSEKYKAKFNESVISNSALQERCAQYEKNPITVNEIDEYYGTFSENDYLHTPLLNDEDDRYNIGYNVQSPKTPTFCCCKLF